VRLDSDANTYQGGTNIVQGILEARGSGSLGASTSAVKIDGGTLRLSLGFNFSNYVVALAQPIVVGTAGGTITAFHGSTSFDGGLAALANCASKLIPPSTFTS